MSESWRDRRPVGFDYGRVFISPKSLRLKLLYSRGFPWTIFRGATQLHPCARCVKMPPDAIMKAKLYAQLNPTKTMRQLINDRNLYRLVMVLCLFCAWCG